VKEALATRAPDHRLIVARGFRLAGIGLGAPSSVAALGFGTAALVGAATKPSKPEYLDVSTYGLVGLLSNAATGVGGVLSFINAMAAWVFGMLAVLAFAAALFAGLLYLVGRGLRVSAPWARFVGIAVMTLLSLNTLLAFTFLRGGARLIDAIALAGFGYVLWVLGWRFRDRTLEAAASGRPG
jgi:hypothetical protein